MMFFIRVFVCCRKLNNTQVCNEHIQVALETGLEITLTLKLIIRPLIIEATNFQGKSRTPNTNSILTVFQLVLKNKS